MVKVLIEESTEHIRVLFDDKLYYQFPVRKDILRKSFPELVDKYDIIKFALELYAKEKSETNNTYKLVAEVDRKTLDKLQFIKILDEMAKAVDVISIL